MLRHARMAVLALVALAVPVTLSAQVATPSPEVQGWLTEMQQIQTQLAPVEQQAMMADADLAAEQQALNTAIRSALIEAHPELEAQTERMAELQAEGQAAQQAGDAERLAALTQEAQQIQAAFNQAQMQVLQQPEIAARVDSFRASVQARMVEIDPEVAPLLERAAELSELITEAMNGA